MSVHSKCTHKGVYSRNRIWVNCIGLSW